MKLTSIVLLASMSFAAFAENVNDFNRVLIQDVQKDIKTDNDQALKTKSAPMRGPASVEADDETNSQVIQDNTKFEKRNVRQTGYEKW